MKKKLLSILLNEISQLYKDERTTVDPIVKTTQLKNKI